MILVVSFSLLLLLFESPLPFFIETAQPSIFSFCNRVDGWVFLPTFLGAGLVQKWRSREMRREKVEGLIEAGRVVTVYPL